MPDGWNMTPKQMFDATRRMYPWFEPMRILFSGTGLWNDVEGYVRFHQGHKEQGKYVKVRMYW